MLKNPEIRLKMTELGRLTDGEICQLGRGKKTVKKYKKRLEEKSRTRLKSMGEKSILGGVLTALNQDVDDSRQDDEGPILVNTREDIERWLTQDWMQSLEGEIIGVAAVVLSEGMLRDACLVHVAICRSSDEPLVVDVRAISKQVEHGKVFTEVLAPLKLVFWLAFYSPPK